MYKLSVRRGEIEAIPAYKTVATECFEELERFKSEFAEVEQEKTKLYNEMIQEINVLKDEVSEVTEVTIACKITLKPLKKGTL